MIRLIDRALLAEVSAEAQAHPRRRKNRNFHVADEAPGHRLLNAIEPGSYVMPHRHQDPAKGETMICLQGRLGLVEFDVHGQVVGTAVLAPGSDCLGVDIPPGVFHSVLALERGTVFLEAKAGPYRALTAEERASWAPAEGESAVEAYGRMLRALFGAG